jgi:5-methylcytosine-specific restriction endonuclease McrA
MGTHTKRKTYLLICGCCGVMFEGKKSNSLYCSDKCRKENYKVKKKFEHICLHCKENYYSHRPIQKYCSVPCADEAAREKALEHFQNHVPDHITKSRRARREYTRRKRIREQWVETVDLAKLIERDKGICQLCFEPISLNVDYLHPLAATNDHIIPVSLGGEHSYANCQLAHRKCNTAKNDGRGEKNVQTKQKC